MSTPQLDRIAAEGTDLGLPSTRSRPSNGITCADDTTVSVVAHYGAYCAPRPEHFASDPPVDGYTHVEVGFPSVRPEPWSQWVEYVEDEEHPTETVYGRVPVGLVREFLEAHGGEK